MAYRITVSLSADSTRRTCLQADTPLKPNARARISESERSKIT